MKTIKFYLPPHDKKILEENRRPLYGQIVKAINDAKFKVETAELDESHRFTAGVIEDYALLIKMLVPQENVFTLRKLSIRNYWTIERAEYRNNFRLTNQNPDFALIDAKRAEIFANKTRRKKISVSQNARSKDQPILIALQGTLLTHRKDQYCSPIEMINLTRAHFPDRQIIVKPHPRGGYGEDELKALHNCVEKLDITLSNDSVEELLAQASFVISMNSSVALSAILYHVPSVYFSYADFFHIGQTVMYGKSVRAAFTDVEQVKPEFDKYIYWYLYENMLSSKDERVGEKAVAMMQSMGFV